MKKPQPKPTVAARVRKHTTKIAVAAAIVGAVNTVQDNGVIDQSRAALARWTAPSLAKTLNVQCPFCAKARVDSTVTVQGTGGRSEGDSIISEYSAACSRGHDWVLQRRRMKPQIITEDVSR